MNIPVQPPAPLEIDYPESDGEPMADNTRQFEAIVTIKGGLDAVFWDEPMVFIAGDLFWYPVQGDNKIRTAPDTLVVFGRPKGHRRSYMQWREGGISPQVVFEVLSPGNRRGEMDRKFEFYERYGVEEYYIYDPDSEAVSGFLRDGDELKEIPNMNGWISPRLHIRFDLSSGELCIIGPDGRPFASYVELAKQRDQERQEKELVRQEKELVRQEKELERRQKELEKQRAERLAAQLRALGFEPEA